MAVPAAAAAAAAATSSTAAAGGTAAAGTAAAGTAATAGGTAAAGASSAATAANAGRMANIASKAKALKGNKNFQRGRRAAGLVNNRYNAHKEEKEAEQQEEAEERALQGINPVKSKEEQKEEKAEAKKEKKTRRRRIGMVACGGCCGFGCLTTIIGPALIFSLVVLIPYIVVSWFSDYFQFDVEKALNSGLASCQNCTTQELNALRENQWNDKINALSSEYGSKIDKAALVATVTYSESLADVMALEYDDDPNFDSKKWAKDFESLKAIDTENDEKNLFNQLWNSILQMNNGDAGHDFGPYSKENISLLNYIASGMASSGNTYSDENYKNWLMGSTVNNVFYCQAAGTIESVKRFLETTYDNIQGTVTGIFSGRIPLWQLPMAPINVVTGTTVGSWGYYYNDHNNYVRICEYGYIEGMIEGVSDIKDASKKQKQKERIANEIIDMAEYYREADKAEKAKTTKKKGSVCYYKVPGIEEEVSNIKVQTLQCEYGNEGGKVGDPIPGEGLVDFENEYIPGVVYGEVGNGSMDEVQKAQAVYARSFALNRGQAMNGAYGIGLSIESGQWVLKMRNCTSDQAYCNITQGCGTLSGGTPQGSTSGGPTLYAGGKGNGFYKGPLPEDDPLRENVVSSKGEVAVDADGYAKYLDFASVKQNEWASRAGAGEHYKDFIKDMEGVEVKADCRGEVGEYDLEGYYVASQAAYESPNIPAVDLADSVYGSLDAFNQHIKDNVEAAGFGTREAVVAAGISLVGDYITATGKRLRYDQYTSLGGRQDSDKEGIVNQNFFLDCSSFAWWALYNGGFNIPTYPFTGDQKSWAQSRGYAKDPTTLEGKPGDFLVSDGHIVLIVGNYDGGYYVAEFLNWGIGSLINKYGAGGFQLGGYTLIDMDGYYNDSSNVR